MRKSRKVLSFVLILALILGSFSMVFAASGDQQITLSDIAGLLGEDAIEVCQNLGIITGDTDGTYKPEKLVNRAEFAAIITRALGIPDSGLTGTANFKDTSGYGWAEKYLKFCQDKGIMIGDGQGNAMPGRTITVNEAVTMILRAIGYIDSSSELVGKWPSNYVTLAKAVGLYDDISDTADMSKEMAAIAIYNALVVQLVAVNTDGKTEGREIKDVNGDWVKATLANTGLGCTAIEKQILDDGYFGDTMINISNKIGAYGTAYENKDGALVAFAVDSTFLTGTIDGEKFKVDGTKYTFAQTGSAYYFKNAELEDNDYETTLKNLTGAAAEADGKWLTLSVKVAGTTIKNVYSVVGWRADAADKADEGVVNAIEKDAKVYGGKFVKDDDDAIDLRQFSLVGVQGLGDVAKDDVVYVYYNSDKEIRKLAVGQEKAEGTIDEANADEFVLNDGSATKTIEYANDFLRINAGAEYANVENDIGADAVVDLDAYGYAFKIDTTGGDPGTFGVVTVIQPALGVDNAKVKMYTSADDASKVFSFVGENKVKVNGNTVSSFSTTSLPAIDQKLVGYKLNSAGSITSVDVGISSSSIDVRSATIMYAGGTSYSISSNVVVMSVDSNGDYALSSIANVDYKKAVGQTGQYVLNKSGKVIAILLPADVADKDSESVYAVINAYAGIKSGDDNVQRLTVVAGSTEGQRYDTTTDAPTISQSDLETVNLWKLTLNGDKKVKGAREYGVVQTTSAYEVLAYDRLVASSGAYSTSENYVKLETGEKIPVSSDVIVYEASEKSSGAYEYEVSGLSSIDNGSQVWVYDTKKDADKDRIGTVVIFLAP